MKTLLLTASTLLFFSYTASANCTAAVDPAQKRVFVAEITELQWCWPAVTGGVGAVSYVIESSTNFGEWIVEGETGLPEWALTRNIGDRVELRYYACDEVECTDYSTISREVSILPNFDFYADGLIDGRDFIALRERPALVDSQTFVQFKAVIATSLVGGVYIR